MDPKDAKLISRWNEKAKLAAIDFRFYQHSQWLPKVGDFYCLTRAGLMLCQVVRMENGKIWHRTIVADNGTDATAWPHHEWPAEEFLHGWFMRNRVYVPDWAFATEG